LKVFDLKVLQNFDDMYEVFDYELTGELIKVKSPPGLLLINKHEESIQIFDNGQNIYIILNVEFSKDVYTECFAYIDFLFGTEIYNWQGVKPKDISKKDFLDSRFMKVCST
jgi:hypothetical protein